MKGKDRIGKNSSVKRTDSSSQEKKSEGEKKKEVHRCDECKWYDVSAQRDFFRKVGPKDDSGQRTTIKEVRTVCRSPTSKAKGHLVKNDSDRPCFEKGKYVPSEKPEKAKGSKKEVKKTKNETSVPKRWNNPAKENTVTLKNPLNGEIKTFEKRGRRLVLAKTTK